MFEISTILFLPKFFAPPLMLTKKNMAFFDKMVNFIVEKNEFN